MVMGSVSAGGGSGAPGPAGPPGPMGPPGGPIDPTSPLAVLLFAETTPGLVVADPARPVDYAVLRYDTHGAVIPGPAWTWAAPSYGTYQVVATLALGMGAPVPTWRLILTKNGLPEVSVEFTRAVGQITWLGPLTAGERLQVQLWTPGSQAPVDIDANLSRLAIAGAGVLL